MMVLRLKEAQCHHIPYTVTFTFDKGSMLSNMETKALMNLLPKVINISSSDLWSDVPLSLIIVEHTITCID